MSALLQAYPQDRNGRAIPPIVVWIALSILLHVALLLWAPRPRPPEPDLPPSLTVELRRQPEVARPPEPAPSPPQVVAPRPPAPKPPRPQPKRTPKAPPPVIALDKPRPEAPSAPPPPPKAEALPAPQPAPVPQAPPATDLMAYVEARRRARGEVPAAAPPADVERANRPVLKQPSLAAQEEERRRNGYGSFEIRRRGYDYAEYMFRGWNENFRRNGLELIEVQKGSNDSLDLAVVRSIIGIIRRTEKGDFTWVSRRLGRTLTLSARMRDNAGLEEFMMQEFYDDLHRYR